MRIFDADKLSIKKILFSFKDSLFEKSFSNAQLELLADKFCKYAIFRVLQDSDIVGFYSLYANNSETRVAFLSMIVVKKGEQGKGYGKLLLADCVEMSKRQGMSRLELEVDKCNEAAIVFYKKNSFNLIYQNAKSFFLERVL